MARKPTYEERKAIKRENLDTYKWMVQKVKADSIQIVNRDTGEVKVIDR